MARKERDVLVNPGVRYLRRIGGLTRAMAALAGTTPAALATETGFVAAAKALREGRRLDGAPADLPGAAKPKLVLERVRNPEATAVMAPLERLRRHAWRRGYDERGFDDLMVASYRGETGRRPFSTLLNDAVKGNDTRSFAERVRLEGLARACSITGVKPSTLGDAGAVDDLLANAHAKDAKKAGSKARARWRYALAGGADVQAASALAVCAHVDTFAGRMAASVVEAHASDLGKAGKAAGVAAAKPYAWDRDPERAAAVAELASMAASLGWTHHAAPRADAAGGAGAPEWESALVRAVMLQDDGREGHWAHGAEAFFAMPDGEVLRAAVRHPWPRTPSDAPIDPQAVYARSRDHASSAPVRKANLPEMARTGATNALVSIDGALDFGVERRIDAYTKGVEALQVSRFRKGLDPRIDTILPKIATQAWMKAFERVEHQPVKTMLEHAVTLSRLPDLERAARALDTAPALRTPFAKALTAIAWMRDRDGDRRPQPGKTDVAALRGTALARDGAVAEGRTTVSRQNARHADVVGSILDGASPYDVLARTLEGSCNHRVGRREARQLASLRSSPDKQHHAAEVLDRLKTANPNVREMRPAEVAILARSSATLGADVLRSPSLTRAMVEAMEEPVRGTPGARRVREAGTDVLDTIHAARESFQRMGFDEDQRAVALVRSFAPKGRTMTGLGRIAEDWHTDAPGRAAERHALVADLVARSASAPVDQAARYPEPASTPPARGSAGVSMRQLRSDEAMIAEGVEMDHCVGSYVSDAAAGRLLVYAVEGPNGRSTAGYAVTKTADGTLELRRKQHTGFHNAPAPAENVEAVERHVRAMAQDQGWMADHALAMARAERAQDGLDAGERGLPPQAKAQLEAFDFQSLRPFLSKPDIALGADGYAAMIDAETTRISQRDGALLAARRAREERPAAGEAAHRTEAADPAVAGTAQAARRTGGVARRKAEAAFGL